MEKSENSLSKLKELVIKGVKEGITKEETDLFTSPYWYKYFGYDRDPLDALSPEEPFTESLIELFVNRAVEIKVLSNYFGMCKKLPYSIHIALIGPSGCGKHTTMKIIVKFIRENYSDINFEFYNLLSAFDYKRTKYLTEKQIEKLDSTPLDVRIISCAGKNKWFLIKRIKEFKKNSKMIISIWHSSEYPADQEIQVNKIIYFRNYSKEDVIEILARRVNKLISPERRQNGYFDILLKILIPKIAEFSKGNLKASFMLFKEIHWQARVADTKEISETLIEQIVQSYNKIKEQKITEKEQEIINFYLNTENMKYITTTDLKDELQYDRVIAWKYLENLKKKNIFEKITHGNPSRYKLNDVFLCFYEDFIKKNIIFRGD